MFYIKLYKKTVYNFIVMNDSTFELLLSSLVAVLIMWISSSAESIMPTYGFALTKLMVGQSVILQKLNITANTTSIIEAISQGTISSMNEYSLFTIETIKHAVYQIEFWVAIFIIMTIIFIWEAFKRLINIRKNRS